MQKKKKKLRQHISLSFLFVEYFSVTHTTSINTDNNCHQKNLDFPRLHQNVVTD
jgi:hypothetical protein